MSLLKAFIYTPEHLGLSEFPQGLLQLQAEETMNAEEADIIVCPAALHVFRDVLHRFPYIAQWPEKHVFLDVSDYFESPIGKPCLFIRCNMRANWWSSDPNSIPFAWPVEDFGEYRELPKEGFRYDVSFHGWLSTVTRDLSSQSCLDNPRLRSDIARYDDFTGYIYDQPEGIRRRGEFRRSMKDSRVALCPESIPGVLPYRFFEAMSAARVPILVSSNYVLPFADKIPYDRFIVRIERDQAARAGEIIADFLQHTNDAQLIQMGLWAREFWCAWLNRADWARTMTYAVEDQLSKMLAR